LLIREKERGSKCIKIKKKKKKKKTKKTDKENSYIYIILHNE